MQRSGFLSDAAIEAIDKLEVFEAIIQSFETYVSNSEKTFFLISRLSIMASIVKSESAKSFNLTM